MGRPEIFKSKRTGKESALPHRPPLEVAKTYAPLPSLLPPITTLDSALFACTIEHQLHPHQPEADRLDTILSRSTFAIAQAVSLDAAYLVLLFAAYATDADTPWEMPFVVTGSKLMQQLGWNLPTETASPIFQQSLQQLQQIIAVLQNWFVAIRDIDLVNQRYQMIRVPLWSFGDISLEGVLPQPFSTVHPENTLPPLPASSLKLQISPGSWISLFPSPAGVTPLDSLRQYGDLAKSTLQISPTQHPFAARLAILLMATSGFYPTGQYRVQQLLSELIPHLEHRLRAFPDRRMSTIADWDQALCILRQLGWEVEFDAQTYPEAIRPAWSLPYNSFSTTAQRSDTWVQEWLQAKITLRPTRLIQQQVMLKGERYCSEPGLLESTTDHDALASNTFAFIPGDILEQALLAKGISQAKFAEQLNLDRSMVNRWIKGSRVIQPKHQVQIWRLLGKELETLMQPNP